MGVMSSNAPGPRPRQVTISGWVIAAASAMLVVTVFDTMAGLQSVDTRDALTEALTTGSAKDLGISVDDALTLVRVALFVAGAAAAVTGILGIFVLQRHATARIVLTVAAVPIVLTSPFAGGFLGLVIGVATALLWSRPARDWFAGRPPTPPEAARPAATWPGPGAAPPHVERPVDLPGPASRPAPGGESWPPPAAPGVSTPPPTYGWGQQPHVPQEAQAPGHALASATGSVGVPAGPRVPGQVRVACILTWIFSLLTAGIYLVVAVALAVDRDGMLDLLRDNPAIRDRSITDDQLTAALFGGSAVVVVWCLAACVLALLAWRRHTWAWIVLLVSVGIAALVELLGLPYSLLHLVAAGTVLRLLLVTPTRAWFRDQDGPGASVPPQGWAPPTGQPLPPQYPAPEQPPQYPPPPPEHPSGKPPVW
jgi:hypothetical protein